MAETQGLLFDERFLEAFAGQNILRSPRRAIIELVANCWDAGATRVEIAWPEGDDARTFDIHDNGEGMTDDQFNHRWRTLAYDRIREQGATVAVAAETDRPRRTVFGRNGIGRFAGFCFGDEYFVETWRDGRAVTYRVRRGKAQPLELERIEGKAKKGHGTRLFVERPPPQRLPADEVCGEIGMRFLTDPDFAVVVNGKKVDFSHIPERNIEEARIPVDGLGEITLIVIDVVDTDRTTRQHGVAWHVHGRLVGDCSWKSQGREDLIDGRRIAAKRYTFIVRADCLADAVNKDWTGFDRDNTTFQAASESVYDRINEFFLKVSEADRCEALAHARDANRDTVARLSLRSAEKWEQFVSKAQEECPSIRERDLVKLSTVLANLELAESKYALLRTLAELSSRQLDDLHEILKDWTLDMAKVVLDEIRSRVQLLDELKRKVVDEATDEVQELQPVFKQGLWIFGPEYETIEFTSNEGMTTVVQRLLGKNAKMSLNRPDFAVVPDGTVGLYSYPKYDAKEGGEIGTDRLVIIELKKPGTRISTEQKDQCWKYVKELYTRGLLQEYSNVTCFPLGTRVDPMEVSPREEKDGRVRIVPLSYDTVITRAKSRLLKLYDRVKSAPFLDQSKLTEFLERGRPTGAVQQNLFGKAETE